MEVKLSWFQIVGLLGMVFALYDYATKDINGAIYCLLIAILMELKHISAKK